MPRRYSNTRHGRAAAASSLTRAVAKTGVKTEIPFDVAQ
jgi:hypothetical protein